MPCNTYGPNDDYNEFTSHFYPALISKVHKAKKFKKKFITLWGNGKALRELIYVDDVADACIYFYEKKNTKESLINIGSNVEMSVEKYAKFIIKKLDPSLKIRFDKTQWNNEKNFDPPIAKIWLETKNKSK